MALNAAPMASAATTLPTPKFHFNIELTPPININAT